MTVFFTDPFGLSCGMALSGKEGNFAPFYAGGGDWQKSGLFRALCAVGLSTETWILSAQTLAVLWGPLHKTLCVLSVWALC